MKRNWKDRVKRCLALVLTLVLLTSLVPRLDLVTTAAATETETTTWMKLKGSSNGQNLGSGYYYITADTTCKATIWN